MTTRPQRSSPRGSFWIAGLCCVCSVAAAHAETAAPAMPLFDAFKKYCVDTGTDAEKINAAASRAGAKQTAHGETDWPLRMTITSWRIVVDGRQMLLTAGTQQSPAKPPRKETDTSGCILNGFTKDDASIAALRKWVGAPHERPSTGDREVSLYQFQIIGSQHVAVPDDEAAYLDILGRGLVYSVSIIRSDTGGGVQLVHFLPLASADAADHH